FFFSSRRRHTSFSRHWSSDVCSSDLCRSSGHDLVLRRAQDEVYWGIWPCIMRSAAMLSPWECAGLNRRCASGGRVRRGFGGFRRSEERRVGKEGRSGGAPEEAEPNRT